jgi:hypothetical protein
LTLPLPDIGGKNFFYYLVLFVYGYILMADVRFGEALESISTFPTRHSSTPVET